MNSKTNSVGFIDPASASLIIHIAAGVCLGKLAYRGIIGTIPKVVGVGLGMKAKTQELFEKARNKFTKPQTEESEGNRIVTPNGASLATGR